MFNFFKNRRSKILDWEINFIKTAIAKLPKNMAAPLNQQIAKGIITGVRVDASDIPGYVAFKVDPKILQLYDDQTKDDFTLENIIIENDISNNVKGTIYIISGTINGYSLSTKLENINNLIFDTSKMKVKYPIHKDYNTIAGILSQNEREIINPSQVYSVVLNNEVYYHLIDTEDGNFIGMDLEKNFFEINHDPQEINLINKSLMEIFEKINSK